jgi:hypothetical protein
VPARSRVEAGRGVHYIDTPVAGTKRIQRTFYIVYRKNGRLIEEDRKEAPDPGTCVGAPPEAGQVRREERPVPRCWVSD